MEIVDKYVCNCMIENMVQPYVYIMLESCNNHCSSSSVLLEFVEGCQLQEGLLKQKQSAVMDVASGVQQFMPDIVTCKHWRLGVLANSKPN